MSLLLALQTGSQVPLTVEISCSTGAATSTFSVDLQSSVQLNATTSATQCVITTTSKTTAAISAQTSSVSSSLNVQLKSQIGLTAQLNPVVSSVSISSKTGVAVGTTTSSVTPQFSVESLTQYSISTNTESCLTNITVDSNSTVELQMTTQDVVSDIFVEVTEITVVSIDCVTGNSIPNITFDCWERYIPSTVFKLKHESRLTLASPTSGIVKLRFRDSVATVEEQITLFKPLPHHKVF